MDPERLDRAAMKNDEIARKFDAKSQETSSQTHGLDQRALILDARWEGVAQSRFFEHWDEEKQQARRYADLLSGIAADLRGVAGHLRSRAQEERRWLEEDRRRREEEERRAQEAAAVSGM